ncbi:hypothetical protein [Bradyrhizobium erythrophlei]|uniref:hypothetical protein n=1 Tax=Bradyrhizobium erythrophlei TaxID=1437360 RepID=UPI0012AC1EB5|nr:hypothetical protein [Bradyrhizobium erythrophlei]
MKLADSLRTPGWTALLAGALIWFGFILIRRVADQLTSIICFAIASLILFHVLFWLLREATDDKALKIIDYMYLGLALCGVFGIIDLQSKIAKDRYQFVVSYYLPDLQKVKPCRNPKGKECDFATSMLNIITTPDPTYFATTKQLFTMLKGWQDYKLNDEDTTKFVSKFSEMTAVLDEDVMPYLRLARSGENQFIWYYILAASLALRLTKVTVELFKWHVPKEDKVAPEPAAEAIATS